MNKDQKQLELLYENISSPTIQLTRGEKEFCRRVSEEIVEESKKFKPARLAPTQSLSTFLNILGEKFGSYTFNTVYMNKIDQILEETIEVPKEHQNIKKYVYLQNGYGDFIEATHLKLYADYKGEISEGSYFTFHTPMMQIIAKVPFKDKEQWSKLLQPTMELFLIDYLERISTPKFQQTAKKSFAKELASFSQWHKEHAKYEGLRKKLPELEGLI